MSTALTVYIVAHSVVSDLNNAAGWDKALTRLRSAHADSVVLESYRGGMVVDEAVLRVARDRFNAEGFRTLGGLMPVWGEGFGKRGVGVETQMPFFCYSSEDTVSAIEREIRKLSRLFDQVVIDDAFMTSCRCADCEKARNGQNRGAFRRTLLTKVSERWVRAAHEEKPKVQLTVKFPQTYDRYHLYGYDPERFPAIFDKVWVGTETRNPNTPKFGYTEPYQGYFNSRWMRACAGDKFEGAWIDYIECDKQQFYDQAVTSHLGGATNLTLFCYGDALFTGTLVSRMTAGLPGLRKLSDAAIEPWGVHVIKPATSEGSGDLFIYDDFGMMGIPCVPATRLDKNMRSAIVPAQGMSDPNMGKAIADAIASGGQVIVTHAALAHATDAALLALFGYSPATAATARTIAHAFEVDGKKIELAKPFHVPGTLEPGPTTKTLAWVTCGTWDNLRIPFITVKEHPGGGKAIVWNLGTFGQDAYTIDESLCVPVKSELLTLPAPVIALLRNTALAPLGLAIDAPPRVATYLFAKHAVFVNYTAAPAEVRTTGLGLVPETLTSDRSDPSDKSDRSEFDGTILRLPAGSYAMMDSKPAR
ncbi:MAG: hypothetical protein HZB26_02655 [Candidatus Hydrogenedentes bacterium]|nr:hypothetical protein [Candidatus Hydrogenedentota bacterium]